MNNAEFEKVAGITPAEQTDDAIEGLGDKDDDSWGDYPIDTLLIRNESRTVYDVLRRIGQGNYIMDPEFQRDFIWPQDKQSKLIESVLMRIPLPVFYLAEDDQGRMVVVDGLQRLSTFKRFVDGELRLSLPSQDELHKKKFDDLSPRLQNRIEDCNLIFYIIDSKVPERTRLDIFERVNGGEPLTRQQMRNSLYMGEATRFLKTESRTEIFSRATGGSLNIKTMRDREFVNRFCAFQIFGIGEYKGDMDDFLARTLREMNAIQPKYLLRLSDEFRNSLKNNYAVFGWQAFRKHAEKQVRRSVLNASLWDVMTTGLSRYPKSLVESHSEKLKKGFYRLMDDVDFFDSITYGTNGTRKVKSRFHIAGEMFKEVFGAHSD